MLRDVFVYLLGGVTFVPLCLLCVYIYMLPAAPEAPKLDEKLTSHPPLTPPVHEQAATVMTQHQARGKEQAHSAPSHGGAQEMASWLIVSNTAKALPRKSGVYFTKTGGVRRAGRRATAPDGEEETDDARRNGYMGFMYRGLRGHTPADGAHESEEVQTMPGGDTGRPAGVSLVYYAIFKPPMLYLYNGEDITRPGTECVATISLADKCVSLWDKVAGDLEGDPDDPHAPRPESSEGPLFSKRNALHIFTPAGPAAEHWYIMTPLATQLEEWYFAFVDAAAGRRLHASQDDNGLFTADDMRLLISSLDQDADHLSLRGLNAMLGRIFLALAHTQTVETKVVERLNRRLARVQFPSMISDACVTSVDLGNAAPTFGRPVLKRLQPNGEASMEVAVKYTGSMRVIMGATITIPLGQRFRPYTVPVVLAVVLRGLRGNLLLQVKPPPSNRIWYAFTSMPAMDISIEPVVSARKVGWSLITGILENKVREVFSEAIVMPHMNSVPFFNTQHGARRGGLWKESRAKNPMLPVPAKPGPVVDPTLPSSGPATAPSTRTTSLASTSSVDTQDSESSTTSGRRRAKYKAWLGARTSREPGVVHSNTDMDSLTVAADTALAALSSVDSVLDEEPPWPEVHAGSAPSTSPPSPAPDIARSRTSDEFGEIPAARSRRSRINSFARTLHDTVDRDPRTFNARDAKEALKRGWSSWGTKRVDGHTTPSRSFTGAVLTEEPGKFQPSHRTPSGGPPQPSGQVRGAMYTIPGLDTASTPDAHSPTASEPDL